MGFVLIHIAYFFLKPQDVSYFSCFTSINFSKPSWRFSHTVVFFLWIPLLLWIGLNLSTRCGRVHFEHCHRKWLVITVRPTTSVRKSPRKNLPPRNTPDSFCRCFTRQNPSLCCMGGIFLLRETHLENFMSRPNVIPTFRQRRCKTGAGTSFGANGDPLTWAAPPLLIFAS